MPRQLTPRGLRALQLQTENAAWLSLVTISHQDTGTLWRTVNNTVAIVSRGRVFSPFAFSYTLAQDSMQQQAAIDVVLDNTDLRFIGMLRQAITPPVVTIELVVSDTPDVTEIQIDNLQLREVSWNAGTITGKLMVEDVFSQAFPSRSPTYDPAQFAGLFT